MEVNDKDDGRSVGLNDSVSINIADDSSLSFGSKAIIVCTNMGMLS